MPEANSKKIFLVLSFFVMTVGLSVLFAQNNGKHDIMASTKEIKFITGKWKDVVTQAKKSGKYIFVDAYTTWCMPCRQLKNVTFKNKNAADYFNSNFINYTVDMEKGEGEQLAEEWDITAYPTLLLFTPEGNLAMKQIGYVDGKQLIEFGKQALVRK